MKKYCFKKTQTEDGYNEVMECDPESSEILAEEYEILKGDYENADEAIKALNKSNWHGVMNYVFVKK